MENLLLRYFEARIKSESEKKLTGPVITISREYGCPSKILAEILADKLNKIDLGPPANNKKWKWISRELMEEAARDLKVDPRHINHIFDYQERSIVDDILAATKKDGSYKSDHAIKKSIGKVIRNFAEMGNVIIIGRAGVALTRDIKCSLHIRLMAPLDWRITRTMQTQGLAKEKALELITSKDANRKRFLEYYLGQKFQVQLFDAIYNCQFFSLEEIADSIILATKQRCLKHT
jgi:cytidylate kinase